jgi:protein-S-isoprenylcysteine O-methyltransferase Ste14
VLQAAAHLALPVARVIPLPWSLAGLVLVTAGVAVNIVADRQFTAARTTVNPFGAPTTLVTTGPFRVSRHPMYLGMVSALLGVAVTLGSATPFLVPPAFAVLLTVRFIHAEEAALAARFGDAWTAYAARTRRWI